MAPWTRRRKKLIAAAVAGAVLLGVVCYFWETSLLPGTYSIMAMGYPDDGGGTPVAGMASMAGGISVADLTGPSGTPEVSVTLTARRERFTLPSGQSFDGYTLNHQSPGPTIHAVQGDLVQVTLINANVTKGVTLHWHGVDVPDAEDGVPGVTQNAVPVGGRFVYRFRVNDAGTYWYHSHQYSSVEIPGGLWGPLIVAPRVPESPAPDEVIAAVHTYGKYRTDSGYTGTRTISAAAGTLVRVRIINTDSVVLGAAVGGTPFRVVAHDGYDITAPTPLTATSVVIAAGGRADLEFTVGVQAETVDFGQGTVLRIGPAGTAAPVNAATGTLNWATYGSPAPLPFDPAQADRHFTYTIGRMFGFEDGKPGRFWTVNGHLYPDIPMFEVDEGDIVEMTIVNDSGVVHPMHLHGHHAVVISRDGQPTTGSPWWTDSLDVESDSTYVIAFVADNPGVWMDHCHNLNHAVNGLVSHLAYGGITDPYEIGGEYDNHPS